RQGKGLPGQVARHEPEGDAAIIDEHKIEEARDLYDSRWVHDPLQDDPLAGLIQQHDQQGKKKNSLHPQAVAAPRRLTASAQRPQVFGTSALLPTSGKTRQQRSHFSPGARRMTTATPGTSS